MPSDSRTMSYEPKRLLMNPVLLDCRLNRLKFGRKNMNESKCNEICRTGEDEHGKVRAFPLENVANDLGDEHSAHRARHAPEADNRPDHSRGNMSDAVVKMFADQPWWAAAAKPTSNTPVHRCVAREAKTIGTTASARISMAVWRSPLTVQPRLINEEESQPPQMLLSVARL